MSAVNSFGAKDTLHVGDESYEIFRIDTVPGHEKLPFSLKVLLENLLRTEDGANVTKAQIEALGSWVPTASPTPRSSSRRLASSCRTSPACPASSTSPMREAVVALGGDPNKINPLSPAEMVIDHSVIADLFGTENALERNVEIEYERNGERYQFLRWGQTAFDDFKVVPPGTGIVHQVNIEHLAKVIYDRDVDGVTRAYPDTCVGTDSHTTMVNGLGVLGWGVGGIEAEAAMLGQPVSMLIPKVVGFKLSGEIPMGVTATDVVLTITDMLRKHGVVGKFVEFYGSGVASVPLANRATIGNMSPEFGSTAAIFPIDDVTLEYLRLTGRSDEQIALVEDYSKTQKLWHDADNEAGLLRVPRARPVDRGSLDRRPEAPAGPHHPRDAKAQFEGPHRLRRGHATSSTSRRRVLPGLRPARQLARGRVQPPRAPPPLARAEDGVEADEGRRRRRRELRSTTAPSPSRPSRRARTRRTRRSCSPRPPRPQRGEEGPEGQAVGEDHARAGLEGRHRVLREGRPHQGPRGPRLLHGRLRLHHLHRQLGPAHRGGLGSGAAERLAVTAVLSGNRNFEVASTPT